MWIFSHRSRSSKGYRPGKRGFTLFELLVVMAIMVVVTSVMLFNQAKFDSSTILRSLAYSVALSVRQAQVYGTSVLGTSTPQVACSGFYAAGVCYVSAYGVYFNAASPGQYILFADLNNNGHYDTGENIKVFSFSTGYAVSQFCVTGINSGNPVTQCSNTTISSLSILFKRPNPDAQFTALNASGNPISGDIYTSATIQMQNQGDPSGARSTTVTNTGLISAQ
jgi:prepilin-type N-terminal cleavage/methylation domain-containing protein